MTPQELHRYREALTFAHNAEVEILKLRVQLRETEAKLAEMTELAGDCIAAIATLDNRHHEVESTVMVVVLA